MKEHSEILQTLLKKRGLKNKKDVQAFLNPSYDTHLHDPFLMLDMHEAVERILTAFASGEKIAIYSDFDADGIPAGVLLHDFFNKIGYTNFVNYIPHRDTEGYGFHKEAVDKLAKEGVSLILTVDVGITASKTVDHAKELGVDVIITDHHQTVEGNDFSNAVAVLNPAQKECSYPFKGLCGTGVAYKLVQAIITEGKKQRSKASLFQKIKSLPEGWEKWLLDLVAIATVADMVPLIGENRTLVHWGLVVLRKSPRVGVRALCHKLRLNQALINENDIGFSIGPRINAASRMGHPEEAFNLLATTDMAEAEALARKLESLNNKRKGSVAAIVRQAKTKVSQAQELLEEGEELPQVVVTGDPQWSPALVGLAAGSLSDSLQKVVCVWGREGTGTLKGSCRSGGRGSIVSMFEVAGNKLLYYGGHHAAGGFAMSDEAVHTISNTLNTALNSCKKALAKEDSHIQHAACDHDIELTLRDMHAATHREVVQLAPYGVGNPKPVVKLKGVTITSIRHFGKEQNHIEVYIKDGNGASRKMSKFFATAQSFTKEVIEGSVVDAFVHLEESSFAGRRSLELRIVDIV